MDIETIQQVAIDLKKAMDDGLIVRKSSSQARGMGIFAVRQIEAGVRIGHTKCSMFMNDSDFIYPFDFSKHTLIRTFDRYRRITIPKYNILQRPDGIYTNRRILAGEELFVQYGVCRWFNNLYADMSGKRLRCFEIKDITHNNQQLYLENIRDVAHQYDCCVDPSLCLKKIKNENESLKNNCALI